MSEWVNDCREWVSEWVSGGLINWFIEWVSEWAPDWLIHSLIHWMSEWVSDFLTDWLLEWLLACLIQRVKVTAWLLRSDCWIACLLAWLACLACLLDWFVTHQYNRRRTEIPGGWKKGNIPNTVLSLPKWLPTTLCRPYIQWHRRKIFLVMCMCRIVVGIST